MSSATNQQDVMIIRLEVIQRYQLKLEKARLREIKRQITKIKRHITKVVCVYFGL